MWLQSISIISAITTRPTRARSKAEYAAAAALLLLPPPPPPVESAAAKYVRNMLRAPTETCQDSGYYVRNSIIPEEALARAHVHHCDLVIGALA
jgi:hypothetical protein